MEKEGIAKLSSVDIYSPLLYNPDVDIFNINIKTKKGESIYGTIFNITNNVMGAGFLALPWVFSQGSLLYSSLLLLIGCILSVASFVILADCCETTQTFDYGDLGNVNKEIKTRKQ